MSGERLSMTNRQSPQPQPLAELRQSGLAACLFCEFRSCVPVAMDNHYLSVHRISHTNMASFGVGSVGGGVGGGEASTAAAMELPAVASTQATNSAMALGLAWLQLMSRQSLQTHSFLLQQHSRTLSSSTRHLPLPLPPPPPTISQSPPQPPPPAQPQSSSTSSAQMRRLSAASGTTSSSSDGVSNRNVESLARKVWALGGSLNCLPSAHYSATCRRCGREVKLTERKVQKFKLHIQSCYRKLLRASGARAGSTSSTAGD